MHINLTDGKSQFTFHFNEHSDFKECAAIRQSSRPVTLATRIANRRIAEDTEGMKLYPVAGQALHGLEVK